MWAGDLHQAIAALDDGLAALPADAGHDHQRVNLLFSLATAVGLAGDEERAAACHREVAALTAAGGEFIRRRYTAYSMWALGLAVWRRGDLDRATELQQQALRLRTRRDDRMGHTFCVEALAWIAASGRQYERAAVLLGTAASLWQSMALTLDNHQPMADCQRDCERQARKALGETAFGAAYNRGLQLPEEEAIGYALQQSPTPGKSPTAAVPGAPALAAPEPSATSLTAREMQVARLVAQGSSNKQIAARLVISQRTAEGHVEHILVKLGFTSRAQVAAWIAASHSGDRR